MKKEFHTVPVAEAFVSGDECPFCNLHRQTEQRAIRHFAGPAATYMAPECRAITNDTGFCPTHTKKLYDYGNTLGVALMLQTHCETLLLQLQEQTENYEIPQKRGLFQKKKPESTSPQWVRLQQQVNRCAICDQIADNMQRHFRVFFDLLQEEEFRQMVASSKGFCLGHFAQLLQEADTHLPQKQAQWFYPTVQRVMAENLQRVKADLDRLIIKYDYRNADLPWENAKDSLQRMVQKLSGIYPADPPYRKD